MNISSHEEYGLRCALQLAKAFGQGPLSASRIAQKEGISVEYVSKFMHIFRKKGLVSSVRGTRGGFALARAPQEFSVKEVLDALALKKDEQEFCHQFSGKYEICMNHKECSVRPLWFVMKTWMGFLLSSLQLADLCASEQEVAARIDRLLVEMKGNLSTKELKNGKEHAV